MPEAPEESQEHGRDARGRRQGQLGLAGPPPAKLRMQFPHSTNQHKPKNRRISTIRFQYLKYNQGNCMRNS